MSADSSCVGGESKETSYCIGNGACSHEPRKSGNPPNGDDNSVRQEYHL